MAKSKTAVAEEIATEEVKLKKTYSLCSRCNGTGSYLLPLGEVKCEVCDATGIIHSGFVEV